MDCKETETYLADVKRIADALERLADVTEKGFALLANRIESLDTTIHCVVPND